MAEMLPLGFRGEPTVDDLETAARIGAELGADIIKTKYRGPSEAYREVTRTCFVPVVVLGGSARDITAVQADIREAMQAGAAGVAIGRSVWRADDVRGAVAAVSDAVRGVTANTTAVAREHGRGPLGGGDS
jgi:DhnA family fructose-bisphosphate aldolase class Ia